MSSSTQLLSFWMKRRHVTTGGSLVHIRRAVFTRSTSTLSNHLLQQRPNIDYHSLHFNCGCHGPSHPSIPIPLQRLSASTSSTFVSKHNTSLNVTMDTVSSFLRHHHLPCEPTDLRCTTSHVVLRICPFCPKPHNDKLDNMFKLFIKLGDGAFFCHRCNASGSWYDFKRRIAGYDVLDTNTGQNTQTLVTSSASTNRRTASTSVSEGVNVNVNMNAHVPLSRSTSKTSPMPHPYLAVTYISNLLNRSSTTPSSDPSASNVLHYLTHVRGLHRSTLMKYGVGMAIYKFPHPNDHTRGYVDMECVTFPWIMRGSEIQQQERLRGNDEFVWTCVREQSYSANTKGPKDTNDLEVSKTRHHKMLLKPVLQIMIKTVILG